jgi:16S rRNA (adenine1518-N6/adenine1519-N6)-dimethyltransferase
MASAKKRFGQNFLCDQSIIYRISQAIGCQETDHIVEIGPGKAALTQQLVNAHRLDIIEIDNDLITDLNKLTAQYNNIILHHTDALKFDYAALGVTFRLVGNLPYNISTPLLFHLLEFKTHITDMHFMLQKEVVNRICAIPNTKSYGRLSIMLQYHCQCANLFAVPATAFKPQPKVESAIVKLIPHTTLPYVAQNYAYFQNIVSQAFSQRRKTIKNTLKGYVSFEQLIELNLDPSMRPEQLSIADYVALANLNS